MTARLPLLQRAAMTSFRRHREVCPKCAQVDPDRPATLARACAGSGGGAVMLRGALNKIALDDRKARRAAERRAEGASR